MLALNPEDAIHIENKTKCIQGKKKYLLGLIPRIYNVVLWLRLEEACKLV